MSVGSVHCVYGSAVFLLFFGELPASRLSDDFLAAAAKLVDFLAPSVWSTLRSTVKGDICRNVPELYAIVLLELLRDYDREILGQA